MMINEQAHETKTKQKKRKNREIFKQRKIKHIT